MGRIRYALIGILLALPLVGWVAVAHSQSFRSGNNVTVADGQVVNSTLFVAGRTVDIAGDVNGDVFCAGNNVHVSGNVQGDVICAGQNVTVTGQVSGDVRLAGQDVTLGGAVGGNATIGAQSFVQRSGSTIGGDITLGGQDAILSGSVGRDVAGGTGTLTIAGAVGRNVQANVNQLNLNNNADIGGNINYTSTNKLSRSGNTNVDGTITKQNPTKQPAHTASSAWSHWPWLFYLCGVWLIMALVLVLLMPRVFEHTTIAARAHIGKVILIGLIAGIIIPLIVLGLAVSIVGLPLALLLGLAWSVVLILAGPFAAYLLGRLILRGRTNALLVMLVGAVILFLLYLIPIAGVIIWIIATWIGLGMILLQWHHIGRPHYVVGMEPATETKRK